MLLLLALLSGLFSAPATGPVTWSFTSVPQANGTVNIEFVAHVEDGWHIYATELPSDQGPIPTQFTIAPSKQYVAIGGVQEPKPVEQYDPNFAMTVRHHSGQPRFVLNVKPAVAGAFQVEGEVEFMVCNDKTCLPPVAVPFKITVEQGKK